MMLEPATRAYPAFAAKLLEQHRNIERVLILIRLQVDSLHAVNSVRDLRLIDHAVVYMSAFPAMVHDPSEEFLFNRLTLRSPSCAPLCSRLSRQQNGFETLSATLLGHLRRAQSGDERAYKLVKESGIAYCLEYADHIHCEETDMFPSARRKLSRDDWLDVGQQAGDAYDQDPLPELKTHDSLYDFLMASEPPHRDDD